MKRLLLSLFLLFSTFTHAENDLLPADEAFSFKARVVNDEILLNWDIAQGYYLYKEKIKISSDFSTQLVQQNSRKPKLRTMSSLVKLVFIATTLWWQSLYLRVMQNQYY